MAVIILAFSFPGVNLPEKHHFSSLISKLPFSNSEHDTTVVFERKQGLEKYLQVSLFCSSILLPSLHLLSLFWVPSGLWSSEFNFQLLSFDLRGRMQGWGRD